MKQKYDRYFEGRAIDHLNELVASHGEQTGRRLFYVEMNKRRTEYQKRRKKKNRKKKR